MLDAAKECVKKYIAGRMTKKEIKKNNELYDFLIQSVGVDLLHIYLFFLILNNIKRIKE